MALCKMHVRNFSYMHFLVHPALYVYLRSHVSIVSTSDSWRIYDIFKYMNWVPETRDSLYEIENERGNHVMWDTCLTYMPEFISYFSQLEDAHQLLQCGRTYIEQFGTIKFQEFLTLCILCTGLFTRCRIQSIFPRSSWRCACARGNSYGHSNSHSNLVESTRRGKEPAKLDSIQQRSHIRSTVTLKQDVCLSVCPSEMTAGIGNNALSSYRTNFWEPLLLISVELWSENSKAHRVAAQEWSQVSVVIFSTLWAALLIGNIVYSSEKASN